MVYQGHTGPITYILLSNDSMVLFTCSSDQTIKSYNIQNGTVKMTYTWPINSLSNITLNIGIEPTVTINLNCICLSPDNK